MKKRIICIVLLCAVCVPLLCGCEPGGLGKVFESAKQTVSESLGILGSVPGGVAAIREEKDRNTVLDDGGVFRYYGSLLTEKNEIALYNSINAAISSHSESIDVITGSIDRLLEIVNLVRCDHPEYFWFTDGSEVNGYEMGERYFVKLSFNYGFDAESSEAMRQKLESATAGVIARLEGLGEYEKVKGVYSYIINTSRYDEYSTDQSCYTLLTAGRGVCAGYASACSYLLNAMGVDNIYVYGSSKGQEHAWNLVRVEGNWLQLDTTWGDPVTDDGTQRLSWQYFLLNDSDMLKNHAYSRDILPLPECSSADYGYYIKEGRLLADADKQLVGDMLADAVSKGETLEFRCSDRMVYSKIKEILFTDYGVWDIVAKCYEQYPVFDSDHISYSCDDQSFTVLISPVYR